MGTGGALYVRASRARTWDEFRGDRHERNPLGIPRGFDFRERLVLGLALVMGQDLSDSILVPARWKLLLLLDHHGFLRCRRIISTNERDVTRGRSRWRTLAEVCSMNYRPYPSRLVHVACPGCTQGAR